MKSRFNQKLLAHPLVQKEICQHFKNGIERGQQYGRAEICDLISKFISVYYTMQDDSRAVKFLVMALEERIGSYESKKVESYVAL